jgi:hypothetical protein
MIIYDECGREWKVLWQYTCRRFEENHEDVRIATFMPVTETRISKIESRSARFNA